MTLARRTKIGLAVCIAAVLVVLAFWLTPPLTRFAELSAQQASAPAQVGLFESADDAARVSAIRVDCYPRLGPEGCRYTDDPTVIAGALAAFESASFGRWDGRAGQLLLEDLFPPEPMSGGYSAGIAFLDENGNELAVVGEGGSSAPSGYLYVRRNDCIYLVEGTATAGGDCLDSMISDACADDELRPEWNEDAEAPLDQMTWLFEDEWRAQRGLSAPEA